MVALVSAQKVGILLIDGYPLIPFSCVLEVLRTANRLSNCELFEWRFYAPNSKSVTSINPATIYVVFRATEQRQI